MSRNHLYNPSWMPVPSSTEKPSGGPGEYDGAAHPSLGKQSLSTKHSSASSRFPGEKRDAVSHSMSSVSSANASRTCLQFINTLRLLPAPKQLFLAILGGPLVLQICQFSCEYGVAWHSHIKMCLQSRLDS